MKTNIYFTRKSKETEKTQTIYFYGAEHFQLPNVGDQVYIDRRYKITNILHSIACEKRYDPDQATKIRFIDIFIDLEEIVEEKPDLSSPSPTSRILKMVVERETKCQTK